MKTKRLEKLLETLYWLARQAKDNKQKPSCKSFIFMAEVVANKIVKAL